MIEIIITVALAAILATLAIPAFSSFINNTRQASAFAEITSDLNRTRSEAIKRNSWVLVCVRNSQGTNCGTSTNWQNGWIVCHISNSTASSCSASTPVNPNPITIHEPINPNLTLSGNTAIIRFNPNGTQGSGSTATLTLNGTWDGALSKIVRISANGHISKY